MRRKKGFIDVDKMLYDIGIYDIEISSLKNNSKIVDISMNYEENVTFGFDYDGTTYFYKYDGSVDSYNELIAEELARDFGLSCVSYDLALLNDKKGVISENYKKSEYSYIDGEEIITDYYESRGSDIEKQNNLESIWDALEYRYRDLPNKRDIIQKLMEKLVKIFIFDIITSQKDRHPENWQIMESENNIDVAPLFDNERIGITTDKYVFCSLTLEEKICGDLFENLQLFLNVSSEEYRNIIKEKMWIISEENLQSVFKRIEDKTGYPMPQEKKDYYLSEYQSHSKKIQQLLKTNEDIRKR